MQSPVFSCSAENRRNKENVKRKKWQTREQIARRQFVEHHALLISDLLSIWCFHKGNRKTSALGSLSLSLYRASERARAFYVNFFDCKLIARCVRHTTDGTTYISLGTAKTRSRMQLQPYVCVDCLSQLAQNMVNIVFLPLIRYLLFAIPHKMPNAQSRRDRERCDDVEFRVCVHVMLKPHIVRLLHVQESILEMETHNMFHINVIHK